MEAEKRGFKPLTRAELALREAEDNRSRLVYMSQMARGRVDVMGSDAAAQEAEKEAIAAKEKYVLAKKIEEEERDRFIQTYDTYDRQKTCKRKSDEEPVGLNQVTEILNIYKAAEERAKELEKIKINANENAKKLREKANELKRSYQDAEDYITGKIKIESGMDLVLRTREEGR
jgi:hypothetical protein